jgi:uncharacterized protein YbjT (DUF2867 family)
MFVITGATGNTGSVAADALLGSGKKVRVVVRDARKGDAWKAKGAEVAVAGFDNPAAMADAFRGAEGVYLLLPPFLPNETDVAAGRQAVAESMLAAVRDARPAHVVLLSSIGVQHQEGTGPIKFLHPIEKGLAALGAPVTFLRASYFMENWGTSLKPALETGKLFGGLDKAKKIPMVATEDIGRTAAAMLAEPVATGTRVVELGGPETYSFADAAAALSTILGPKIEPVQLPIDQLVGAMTGMGLSQEVAGLYGELTGAINQGHVTWEGGTALPRRGQVTLESVLRKLLAA